VNQPVTCPGCRRYLIDDTLLCPECGHRASRLDGAPILPPEDDDDDLADADTNLEFTPLHDPKGDSENSDN
jgi:hypothetical protein